MNQSILIRREKESEYFAVEALTRDSFWNVYHPGALEHYVLHHYRSRPDFVPELDLVLEENGELIAHVMYARAHIDADDGRKIPVMTFGPISVRNDKKRQGYGTRLLRYSMEKATRMGAGALLITGNIGFYGKSGFTVASGHGIHYYAEPRDNPVPYFLLAELEKGYLDGITGVYRDPDGYDVDPTGEAFLAYDALFPPREKLVLPGQLNH